MCIYIPLAGSASANMFSRAGSWKARCLSNPAAPITCTRSRRGVRCGSGYRTHERRERERQSAGHRAAVQKGAS